MAREGSPVVARWLVAAAVVAARDVAARSLATTQPRIGGRSVHTDARAVRQSEILTWGYAWAVLVGRGGDAGARAAAPLTRLSAPRWRCRARPATRAACRSCGNRRQPARADAAWRCLRRGLRRRGVAAASGARLDHLGPYEYECAAASHDGRAAAPPLRVSALRGAAVARRRGSAGAGCRGRCAHGAQFICGEGAF